MAERPDAYFRKNPGDVIRSSEWNELQVKAREEVRAHRHTGNEDGSLIPRAGIEAGAIDGKLIDPAAEVSVKTLTTSGNLTVKGELAVNGKALLGDIADLLATVKSLQDDKLNRRGDSVSGTLRVQRNLLVDGDIGIGTTAPTHRLHVVALDAVGLFESSGETACLRLSTKEGLDNRVEITNRPGGRLSLWNNGEDVLNITRNGNVGIGTITPSQKLTVQGGHNAGRDPDSGLLYGGQLAIKSNACQIDFIDTDPGHDDWAIMVNGSKMHFIKEPWTYTNLVLAANGNVGIGTDSPAQQLTITGGLGFANQNSGDKKLYSPKDGLLEWMTHESAGEHGFAVSHQGEARVYLNTNGNSYLNGGNVGIGTTTPGARLHVKGDVRVDGGDVTVDGAMRAKALQTTLYAAGGGGPLPMSSDNVWRDVGDLTVSVSLSQPATALIFYQITMPGSQHLVTRLAVDNNPIWQTRAITGDTRYWSPSSLWMGALAAGTHVIKVQYRTPTGGTNNPSGDDWQNRTLNVLILGAT